MVLQQNYKYLFETIQSENDELFSQIESLNKQIQNIDNIRIKANERLEFIVNSDNAALGNVSDISFRANTVILENIGLMKVIPFFPQYCVYQKVISWQKVLFK